MLMLFIMPIEAWFSSQREDTCSYRHLARSVWWTKGKISSVLCCIPRSVGMLTKRLFWILCWGHSTIYIDLRKINIFVISACRGSFPSEVWAICTCIHPSTNTAIGFISSKYTQLWSSARHSWVFCRTWLSDP